MKANGLPAILMSLTILLFGCALADENAFGYPNEVLNGTDLVDIGAFRTAEPSTHAPTGTYTAETGGAVARLTVAVRDGGVSISRRYQEPDLDLDPGVHPSAGEAHLRVATASGRAYQEPPGIRSHKPPDRLAYVSGGIR